MAQKNIGVIVGSLRKAAFSRRIAKALTELAPATLAPNVIKINDLPFYNQDLETDDPPAAWRAFRDRVRPLHGLLFVTPEYNRSMPRGGSRMRSMSAHVRPGRASGAANLQRSSARRPGLSGGSARIIIYASSTSR